MNASPPKQATPPPRSCGRPTRQQAEQLHALILDKASALFLTHGYGATSIEAIAKAAGISKRTFYHRFRDKADLFAAVVHRLVESLNSEYRRNFSAEDDAADVLYLLAKAILKATLMPESLALYRLLLGEARQFPELSAVIDREGARRDAVRHIADLLQRLSPAGKNDRPQAEFAAGQFLHLVCAEPQRRALGLGSPMDEAALDQWCRRSVALFRHGYTGIPA